ncbi:MAG: class I SAM-dependent methyltransferase [Rhodoferax sp.]
MGLFLVPAHDALDAASPWVQRWSHLVEPGATVLDVACGSGRHLHWFTTRGHPVTGIDRDIAGASARFPHAALVRADIEAAPWPLTLEGDTGAVRQFGLVVVTNYLWRPLWPTIVDSVAPGGVLLYETFAAGNETLGRPSRPDFLLQPQELLQVCANLHIVAYENGTLSDPARVVQRIAAVRKGGVKGPHASTPSYPL